MSGTNSVSANFASLSLTSRHQLKERLHSALIEANVPHDTASACAELFDSVEQVLQILGHLASTTAHLIP